MIDTFPKTAAPLAAQYHFSNTEIAFKHKSNSDLRRMYWLFKAMNNKTLTRVGTSLVTLLMRLRLPINGIVKATLFKQFCGGETEQECERTIQTLAQSGIGTVLDYSVEGEHTEAGFDATAATVLSNVHRAAKDNRISFAVFKMTGLARFQLLEKLSTKETRTVDEEAELERVKGRIDRICRAAFDGGVSVMVDAEESWIQDAIDALVLDMMRRYNRERATVFNTIQLYRKDRLAFLKSSFEQAERDGFYLGVKLVRGAYMEKERERAKSLGYSSPIQETKAETDKDYNAAIDFCIAHLDRIYVCIGTHNEQSSLLLAGLVEARALPKNHSHVFFSQLYGMGDHISYTLAARGYNVSKYVPYGAVRFVLPYLIRRAEENSSLSGYVSRELRLIMDELKRRKL